MERRAKVRDFWANVANNPDAGVWAQFYLIAAQKQLERAAADYEGAARGVRVGTPNFRFED